MEVLIASQDMSILSLTDQFMAATDWEQSFILLDKICDALIEAHQDGTKINHEAKSVIINKVSEVDSLCEKFHAGKVIDSASSQAELSSYPWLLYDYYKAESEYIADQCAFPLKKIACFGHGAIPALAMVLLEKNPDLQIDMFDIDVQVTALAEELISRIYPNADVNFITDDISTFSDTKTYDLTIVTNAPIPHFNKRSEPFNSKAVFIRSSTSNGSLLYPRISPDQLNAQGYKVLNHQEDRIYGIHEWIIASPTP